ncbi:MAG: DEAD/DEAH box helicase [Acidimicrobiales bacterium]|nr:DEAD/DEAH box helicase [Acidimicrobiales bacterium]
MALAPEPQSLDSPGLDAPDLRLAPPPLRRTAAFDDLLAELADDGRLVHVEDVPARGERFAGLSRPLPDLIAGSIDDAPLWAHQASAIDLAREGTNVVVATGTASGKSRCFQLPIAEAVNDPIKPGTALVLYPTKALAHDQLRALTALDFPNLVAGAYDGDATREEKAWVRDNANVLLTNPEMLHGGLLPRHQKWDALLMRLRYVVIDELHVLRGIFGTHVAHILRRLRRICRHYGSDPTFIFCSATIGEPARLASALCGAPVTAITDDDSPAGPRRFALLDPPVVDEATGARSSANSECASVAAALVESGHRTITFCRSRKGTELVAADIARRLPSELEESVVPYRAGYLAEERRAIEHELFGGNLRGVVSTSALELGVDIGGLDACVMNGFPGTIASMWQQAGRAGRSSAASVTVLVGGEDQLDRYLMAHPEEVFSRPPEPCVVNTANPYIRNPHLACAAYELPISYDDLRFWTDEELHDGVRDLVALDDLRMRRRWRNGTEEPFAHWCGTGYPSRGISLRSGSSGEVRIVDHHTDRLIGTVDEARAHSAVHTGAIYLHRGQSFEVLTLDLVEREARVVEADGGEYTQARSNTDIRVLEVERTRPVGAATLHLGSVEVITQVTGYQLRESRSRKILSNETLDLPEQRLVTRAFWYTVDHDTVAQAGADVGGTLHAAEHAAIGLLPLFTICDRWDVGGVSTANHADTGAPTIFVYDGYPGGAGIAELGWEAGERHLAATADVIDACACVDGCPSCVQSPKCGNGNEPLDKSGASRLLRAVLATVTSA